MSTTEFTDTLSLRARIMRQLVFRVLRPIVNQEPTDKSRQQLERFSLLTLCPPSVRVGTNTFGDVAVETLTPQKVKQGAVLYLHGGAFITGSARTHRALTSRIAQTTGLKVFVPDYRLAPEHPHPAGIVDCLTVYKALLRVLPTGTPIFIAGDSAGGGLTMSLALRIKAEQLPKPKAMVLISPYVDATLSSGSMQAPNSSEWLLELPWIKSAQQHYLGAQDKLQPSVSPLFADLHDLSPILIQVATDELLYDDSTALARALRRQGGTVELQIWHGLWHVWQLHGGQVPEADRAIGLIAQFINKYL